MWCYCGCLFEYGSRICMDEDMSKRIESARESTANSITAFLTVSFFTFLCKLGQKPEVTKKKKKARRDTSQNCFPDKFQVLKEKH